MSARVAGCLLACAVATGASRAPAATVMQVQGSAHRSPLAGQLVAGVAGIVTARIGSGSYLQDAAGDGDPSSSDAAAALAHPRERPEHERQLGAEAAEAGAFQIAPVLAHAVRVGLRERNAAVGVDRLVGGVVARKRRGALGEIAGADAAGIVCRRPYRSP